jgi:orc1/cdc6 family replication initiation protein
MTDYDELFAETAPEYRIFANKSTLNPLQDPDAVVAREDQQRRLATLLNGIESDYLPATVSIYGPPGTGKTLTTRRVATEFAARHSVLAAEYVNLKECRTLFSAANEILFELTGETVQAYEGLDGAFEAIWTTLEGYPDWTVLILDEVDHITQDSNYDPSDFFYRLLRGEGKLSREIQLSVWLLSNELLEVDLRLDSRVQSAMSDEEVFFPPYGVESLEQVVTPRLRQAFQDGVLPDDVLGYGLTKAAHRWGDARKTLTLFRRAGETAVERELAQLTRACIDDNLDATDQEAIREKLLSIPAQHFFMLNAVTGWTDRYTDEIVQPVTTEQIAEAYGKLLPETEQLSNRAIRNVLGDLELMGLVETWVDSRGDEGRVKQVETTFEPTLVNDVRETYAAQSPTLALSE